MERTASGGSDGRLMERTFVAVKPDGVQRCLVGEIIKRFERSGYHLVGMKMVHPSWVQAERHYAHLRAQPYFKQLCVHFTSGPIVAMVWEGVDVVQGIRRQLGNPHKKGTIRGDLASDVFNNIAHTSDSVESGARESAFWFTSSELVAWTPPPAALPAAMQRRASAAMRPPPHTPLVSAPMCPWSFES